MRSHFYKPYAYFEGDQGTIDELGRVQISTMETLIHEGDYYESRLRAKELISKAQEGFHYLQT